MWKMGSFLNNNNDNCCYTTTATTTTNTTTTTTTATTTTIIIVSLCIEPSQPQRITSGLSTNFTLSPSYSIHKSYFTTSHVKKKKKIKAFLHSVGTQHGNLHPGGGTYFILRAYTGTGVSHSQHRKKKLGEVFEKMQVNGPER